jgi:hypothetical protein
MHSMVYDPHCMTIRSRLGTVPIISKHVPYLLTISYSAHCAHPYIFAHINRNLDSVFHDLPIGAIFILI